SYALTANVTGVPADLHAALPILAYDGLSTAPTKVKVFGGVVSGYAVVATFDSNPNYNTATVNATEQINRADATVKIFNGATNVTNGTAPFTYDALSHALTTTVTGVPAETTTLTDTSAY